MTTVTAKAILDRREESNGQVTLTFRADYDDGANKEWAEYTPALSVSMTVKGAVGEHFQQGDKFTLVFQKD